MKFENLRILIQWKIEKFPNFHILAFWLNNIFFNNFQFILTLPPPVSYPVDRGDLWMPAKTEGGKLAALKKMCLSRFSAVAGYRKKLGDWSFLMPQI